MTIASAIEKMKEPGVELSEIAEALKIAILADRCANDEAFATFLFEDMGPGLC